MVYAAYMEALGDEPDYEDVLAQMTIEWTDNVINQLQYQADEEAGHVTQLGQEIKQKHTKESQTFKISPLTQLSCDLM